MKDLGVQAAQRVATSHDPLRLLGDISQNFPLLASSLSRMAVNASVRSEITANQRIIPAGVNLLLINGKQVNAPPSRERPRRATWHNTTQTPMERGINGCVNGPMW